MRSIQYRHNEPTASCLGIISVIFYRYILWFGLWIITLDLGLSWDQLLRPVFVYSLLSLHIFATPCPRHHLIHLTWVSPPSSNSWPSSSSSACHSDSLSYTTLSQLLCQVVKPHAMLSSSLRLSCMFPELFYFSSVQLVSWVWSLVFVWSVNTFCFRHLI